METKGELGMKTLQCSTVNSLTKGVLWLSSIYKEEFALLSANRLAKKLVG